MAIGYDSQFEAPHIDGEECCMWEWPQPMAEIHDKRLGGTVTVRTREDAEMIVESLNRLIEATVEEE